MKFNITSLKDVKDLTNEELKQTIENTNDLNIDLTKKILLEHIRRKEYVLDFYMKKYEEEHTIVLKLLKKLWNEMKCKTKEMAMIFDEIENDMNI